MQALHTIGCCLFSFNDEMLLNLFFKTICSYLELIVPKATQEHVYFACAHELFYISGSSKIISISSVLEKLVLLRVFSIINIFLNKRQ